jgi:hypothetical protein
MINFGKLKEKVMFNLGKFKFGVSAKTFEKKMAAAGKLMQTPVPCPKEKEKPKKKIKKVVHVKPHLIGKLYAGYEKIDEEERDVLTEVARLWGEGVEIFSEIPYKSSIIEFYYFIEEEKQEYLLMRQRVPEKPKKEKGKPMKKIKKVIGKSFEWGWPMDEDDIATLKDVVRLTEEGKKVFSDSEGKTNDSVEFYYYEEEG